MKTKLILLTAFFLAGCISSDMDYDLVLSGEATKVRGIQIGMTQQRVEQIMGTTPMELSDRRYVYYTARPAKSDKFKSKEGKVIEIYYYRTSATKQIGSGQHGLAAFSDDNLTAVVFIDGKVDAVMSGDAAKTVVEVRFR